MSQNTKDVIISFKIILFSSVNKTCTNKNIIIITEDESLQYQTIKQKIIKTKKIKNDNKSKNNKNQD